MSKPSRRSNRQDRQPITTISDPGGRRISWFGFAVVAIVATGAFGVAGLARQRTSVIGVAPEALIDHWHNSFSVYACDEWLPVSQATDHGNGIHGHGDGLIHIHPSNVQAAGPNATLGEYLEAIGATLSDTMYEPGPGEAPVVLDEAIGCGGQPAELQLAVWSGDTPSDEPVVIEQDLAGHRFVGDGTTIALALVPAGTSVPPNPGAADVNNPGDL